MLKLTKTQEERVLELHRKSIVITSLDCVMKKHMSKYYDSEFFKGYFVDWMQGGITAQNITAAHPKNPGFRAAMQDTCTWHRIIQEFSDVAMQVLSVDDIRRAKAEGKAGVIFGQQGAGSIEDERDFLTAFYKLGHRIMGLSYQRKNLIGDGCGERTDSGLSKFGIQVVEEMNRVGMLIDLTHTGRRSSMDAIEASKYPVIFSHSDVSALCESPYNATDEMIQAMAEKGGVISMEPMSYFLKPKGAMEGTTIDDYVDHMEYAIKLVGVDFVGIGMDLLKGETMENAKESDNLWPEMHPRPYILEKKHPKGLENIAEVPNITKGLIARGYSDDEIQKMIGGNLLRVFGRVWK